MRQERGPSEPGGTAQTIGIRVLGLVPLSGGVTSARRPKQTDTRQYLDMAPEHQGGYRRTIVKDDRHAARSLMHGWRLQPGCCQ